MMARWGAVGLIVLSAAKLLVAGEGSTSTGLALEGGGFRALASDAGFIAGLLAAYGQSQPSTKPLSLGDTGLLKRFGIISSVSGSSWFTAELIYSSSFRSLVEEMAAKPKLAADEFGRRFTKPWLRATGPDDGLFRFMVFVAHLFGIKIGITQDTEMALFFILTCPTWNHFVDLLLNSTSGIQPDEPLGRPLRRAGTNETHWAEGKVWLVDHGVLLPRESQPGRFFEGRLLGLSRAGYCAESHAELPVFAPAMFSVRLGAGTSSKAPVRYIAPFIAANMDDFEYRGTEAIRKFRAESGRPGLQFGENVEEYAGKLSISRVVAASSAFMADAAIRSFPTERIVSLLSTDFTPWVSSAPEGEAFDVAQRLVDGLAQRGGISQHTTDDLASQQVHGLVDGGFTDGTGISQALAAGASEVLAVLNSFDTNDPEYVQRLFPGGDQPVPQSASLFPVFASPSASEVQEQFGRFHVLAIPVGARFLRTIAVGTIRTQTLENPFFGVEDNRSVTLNVVNIGSALTIGSLEDFNFYNSLAQEIIEALLLKANADVVQHVILPMLLSR